MTKTPARAPRTVVARGEVEGEVFTSWLVERTHDRLLTVLGSLRTRLGMRGTDFIHASGDRPDLLDDALHGQRVRLVWMSYEDSNRLYLAGPVTVIPKTVVRQQRQQPQEDPERPGGSSTPTPPS